MEYGRTDIKVERSADVRNWSFGVRSPAVIFDMLCNRMYSQPLRTLVQEYLSNARDAHREVGKSEVPIQVALPSRLEPTLVIRDYGPGISEDRMENVFVFLGESTKRNDNNQTGGFGVGAKVGFAYRESFTIETVSGGTKRVYLAYIGESGVGQLDLIHQEVNDGPTGTAIIIQIREEDVYLVPSYARRCTLFWPVKPIFTSQNEWITANLPLKRRGLGWTIYKKTDDVFFDSNILITVDGIPYDKMGRMQPVMDTKFSKTDDLIVFDFPCGKIDLAVNREDLQFTDSTVQTLTDSVEMLEYEVEEHLTNLVSDADDFQTFLAKTTAFSGDFRFVNNQTFTWRGMEFHVPKGKPKDKPTLIFNTKVEINVVEITLTQDKTVQKSNENTSKLVIHDGIKLYHNDKGVKYIRSDKARGILGDLPGSKVILINASGLTDTQREALFSQLEIMGSTPFSKCKGAPRGHDPMLTFRVARSAYRSEIHKMLASELEENRDQYIYQNVRNKDTGPKRAYYELAEATDRRLILVTPQTSKKLANFCIQHAHPEAERLHKQVVNSIPEDHWEKSLLSDTHGRYEGIGAFVASLLKATKGMEILDQDLLDAARVFSRTTGNRSYQENRRTDILHRQIEKHLLFNPSKLRRYKAAKIKQNRAKHEFAELSHKIYQRYNLLDSFPLHQRHFRVLQEDWSRDVILYFNSKYVEVCREHEKESAVS